MTDEKNPLYLFQQTDSTLLTAIVRGKLNPRHAAMRELANRGLDPQRGNWIGFQEAERRVAELSGASATRIPITYAGEEFVVQRFEGDGERWFEVVLEKGQAPVRVGSVGAALQKVAGYVLSRPMKGDH